MKNTNKHTARFLCLFLLFIICFCLVNTSYAAESPTPTTSASQAASAADSSSFDALAGKTAGVMTGTPQDSIISAAIKDVKLQYFSNATDMALALQTGKIDFYALSSVNFYNMAEKYPEFGYINKPLTTFNVGTIFPKTEKGDSIRSKLNEYIAKLKKNYELDRLVKYWLYPNDWENIDIPQTGENGTLQMATANTLVPFSFMLHDKNVGFDIAIIAGFCKEYGYGLQIENTDFSGILSGISTGKYDLAAGQISWTADRAKSVNFSDFYYEQQIVAIVNTKNITIPGIITSDANKSSDNSNSSTSAVSDSSQNTKNSSSSLIESIRKTLIDDSRWLSILHGLLITLAITAGGFILANLMGALFCAMAMSRSRLLRGVSVIYSSLMQGLPVVVILMLLYYVVFAHSKISNIAVAIVGFGLVFGAYMAQLFKENISGVDKGQTEAALAVGFTKRQAFLGIVFPQAARTMLPGYFRNLINLMKGTAVVGYIAITDLTRVGDIIRSNTYEAIVPLVTIAIIYFLMAVLLFIIMNLIQRKLKGGRKA